MLDIYLCEDNVNHLSFIKQAINNTIMINELDMKLVLATNNPDELLDNIKEKNNLSVYFLDIQLGTKINGLELAVKIRQHDSRGFIVFITSHSEMSYLTFKYKVEALDFIVKDKHTGIAESISDCLININEKYFNIKNDTIKLFKIKTRDNMIVEPFDNILFFQVSKNIHKLTMTAINRRLEFYGTLKEVETKLDSRFYRCKDCCIVNKELITNIDLRKRIIYMINGESCEGSVRLIKGLLSSLNS